MTYQTLPVGVFLHSLGEQDTIESIRLASRAGFSVVQLGPVPDRYLTGDDAAINQQRIIAQLKTNAVKVGSLCVCYEHGDGRDGRGGSENYVSIEAIAETGGYGFAGRNSTRIRRERIKLTEEHIDLAAELHDEGLIEGDRTVLTTHVGFFDRPAKKTLITIALKDILPYAQKRNVHIGIETGPEPVEYLGDFIRHIENETGVRGHLGINFDPSNFLQYGTQLPKDALEYLLNHPELVFGVHIKDGRNTDGIVNNPASGSWKGCETKVGKGHVEFEHMLSTLADIGYSGPLIIEKEGPTGFAPGTRRHIADRVVDVIAAKERIDAIQKKLAGN